MTLSKPGLREKLAAKAAELGFCAFGVASADSAPQSAERLRAWLAEGCHGDMLRHRRLRVLCSRSDARHDALHTRSERQPLDTDGHSWGDRDA